MRGVRRGAREAVPFRPRRACGGRSRRGREGLKDRELARGPGNLCRALAIGPDFDGADLATDGRLWIADDGVTLPVGVSTRVGITKAAHEPLRFYARGNPSVSGPRALSP